MEFNTLQEIIDDMRQGKMVIIMDDENRENEGDLMMAASCVTANDINFMATNGRGLICLTLTNERCKQLNLPLMVNAKGRDGSATNFTVSIEAASGVTTGISAADRAHTIKVAVKEGAKPADIDQPGHIFPLMAKSGGVLSRAGHTEAGCDLARIAGLEASSVIVEILNEDGTMARQPDLERFAKKHALKIGTIEDLISYRVKNEKTIEKIATRNLSTEFGDFKLYTYKDIFEDRLHFALVNGDINQNEPVLVRVHMEDTLIDVFAATHSSGWPLREAMKQIAQSKQGVLVMLRCEDEDNKIIQWMNQSDDSEKQERKPSDIRTDGLGAQILMDIGVKKMKLMTAPKTIHGLSGFNLEIVEYVTG